jgi:hypothetical protein
VNARYATRPGGPRVSRARLVLARHFTVDEPLPHPIAASAGSLSSPQPISRNNGCEPCVRLVLTKASLSFTSPFRSERLLSVEHPPILHLPDPARYSYRSGLPDRPLLFTSLD